MVVVKQDIMCKKRKKESEPAESPQESPKRTKVHAQRKFAQGSNLTSPNVTPVKDKVRSNGSLTSPTSELLPAKRPKTEDFLTFLCLRGTSVAPPHLEFFNIASVPESTDDEQSIFSTEATVSSKTKVTTPLSTTSVKVTVKHSVGRNVDRKEEGVSSKAEKGNKHLKMSDVDCKKSNESKKKTSGVQALKKKYQEKRLAKTRELAAKKISQKVKSRPPVILTRSSDHSRSPVRRKEKATKTAQIISPPPIKLPATKKTVTNNSSKTVKAVTSTKKKKVVVRRIATRSSGEQLEKPKPVFIPRIPKPKEKKRFNLRSNPGEETPKLLAPNKKTEKKKMTISTICNKPSPLPPVKQPTLIPTKPPPVIPARPPLLTPTKPVGTSSKPVTKVTPKPVPLPAKPVPIPYKPVPVPCKPVPVSCKPVPIPCKPVPVPCKPGPTSVKKSVLTATSKSKTPPSATKEKLFCSSMSDFSSEDEQPLIKNNENKNKGKKVAKEKVNKPDTKIPKRRTRSESLDARSRGNSPVSASRPSCRSNAALAMYIQLMGKRLQNDECDEDSLSETSLLEIAKAEKSIEKHPMQPPPKQKSLELKPTKSAKKPFPIREITKPKKGGLKKTKEPVKVNREVEKLIDENSSILPRMRSKTGNPLSDTESMNSDISGSALKIGTVHSCLTSKSKCLKTKEDRNLLIAAMKRSMSLGNKKEKKTNTANTKTNSGKNVKTKKAVESEISFKVTKKEEKEPEVECTRKTRNQGKAQSVNLDEAWLSTSSSEESDVEVPVKKTSTVSKLNKSASETDLRNITDCKRIFQRKSSLQMNEKTQGTASPFSPDHESSVYAFKNDPEILPSQPFRSAPKVKGKSELNEMAINTTLSEKVLPVEQISPNSFITKNTSSASIAIQVDLDETMDTQYTVLESEMNIPQRSMEISTQTDTAPRVTMANTEGPLFYIPLQPSSDIMNSQYIQGVTVKLGTEGPTGPNQRVIMQAKLVTRPVTSGTSTPSTSSGIPIAFPSTSSDFQSAFKTESAPSPTFPMPYCSNKIQDLKASSCSSMTGLNTSFASNRSSSTETTSPEIDLKGSTESLNTTESSRKHGARARPSKPIEPIVYQSVSTFPPCGSMPVTVEAPSFYPTEQEFQDPLEYINKIKPRAEMFGICRIVPPSSFKPECKVNDNMRFAAHNQYIHKMLHRWGPNVKEMMAIRHYLKTQKISLAQLPLIGGMEVDLPRLYQSVQYFGGLNEVYEKKKWQKIADYLHISKAAQDRVSKLDDIYCKYLLPYDTLSQDERNKLHQEVEEKWSLICDNNETKVVSDSDSDDEGWDEMNECVVEGRNMPLSTFYRIARNTMNMWFRTPEPSVQEVEQEYWRLVMERNHHVCVNSGSIDSGVWGYGFSCDKSSPFARHPWNLKLLTNNSGSVLRSMGPVMGVTVPTLHVGMLYTACCWYRDPHGLPWVEYLHTGAKKIWYGVPDSHGESFRKAMTSLIPRYCKKQSLWLPSDTAMVPPNFLVSRGTSLCRIVQEPGQYIIVFPRAFTSSICTGYLVSESVYYAEPMWLDTAEDVFKNIRDNSESSMFSLERLLINISTDIRTNLKVLHLVLPMIKSICDKELSLRKQLLEIGLTSKERESVPDSKGKKHKTPEEPEEFLCENCSSCVYISWVVIEREDSILCLSHAIDWLKEKPLDLNGSRMMYTYDEMELNDLIQKVQYRILQKSQRRPQAKASLVPKRELKN